MGKNIYENKLRKVDPRLVLEKQKYLAGDDLYRLEKPI